MFRASFCFLVLISFFSLLYFLLGHDARGDVEEPVFGAIWVLSGDARFSSYPGRRDDELRISLRSDAAYKMRPKKNTFTIFLFSYDILKDAVYYPIQGTMRALRLGLMGEYLLSV